MLQIFRVRQDIYFINSTIRSYLSSLYYDSGQEIEKKNAPLQQNDVIDFKKNRKMYVVPEWCEEVK